MPKKTKPKRRHTKVAAAVPTSVDHDSLDELSDILGMAADSETIDRLRAEVEEALGLYPSLVDALDNAPRPAHMRAALEPLEYENFKLIEHIDALDTSSTKLLRAHGIDPKVVRKELEKLRSACASAISDLSRQESRHGPTRNALRLTILNLNRIFNNSFRDDLASVPGEPRLAPDRLRIDFVRTALEAAKIPFPESRIERLAREVLPDT